MKSLEQLVKGEMEELERLEEQAVSGLEEVRAEMGELAETL